MCAYVTPFYFSIHPALSTTLTSLDFLNNGANAQNDRLSLANEHDVKRMIFKGTTPAFFIENKTRP